MFHEFVNSTICIPHTSTDCDEDKRQRNDKKIVTKGIFIVKSNIVNYDVLQTSFCVNIEKTLIKLNSSGTNETK